MGFFIIIIFYFQLRENKKTVWAAKSLRAHAFSNILKILQPKKENF